MTVSDDKKVWTHRVREGLKYWDGTPVTSSDVVAHLETLKNRKKGNPFRAFMWMRERFEIVDDRTYKVHLSFPWAGYEPLYTTGFTSASGALMPAAHVEKMGKDLNRNPMGYGPYMMESWDKGERLVAVRNPHFSAPETQYLDRIVFQYVPGPDELYAALKSGDIDVFLTDDTPVALKAIKEGSFTVTRTDDAGSGLTLLNTRRPPLDDVRVRRALAHAYDRKTMNKVLFEDEKVESQDVYGPVSKWHCEDTGYPEYDPEKAKALLADYGKPVRLTLLSSTSRYGAKLGQLTQDIFAKVGVALEVRRVPLGPQYLGAVFKGDYELAGWRLPGGYDPDSLMYWAMHSKSKANRHKFSTKTSDAALDKGRITFDFDERKKAYCTVMKEIAAGVPWLYGFHDSVYVIANKDVRGIPPARRGTLHVARAWLDR